jgi:hypothetical protein
VPFILVFRFPLPTVNMNFAAMRTHHKNLCGIESDGIHIPIPLAVKERPCIPAQLDTFVTRRPILFQTVHIDDRPDTFGLLKPT